MKELIKKLLDPNSGTSSKRVAGLLILFVEILYSQICGYVGIVISDNVLTLNLTLIYVGAGLLGLGILDKFKALK